jgi:hypothetical protein
MVVELRMFLVGHSVHIDVVCGGRGEGRVKLLATAPTLVCR